jgi:hypothetical protein
MKKSDKKFAVTLNGTRNEVGTRSGVANFVRTALETAEVGKDVTLVVHVEAAPVTEEKKAAAPATTETPAAS